MAVYAPRTLYSFADLNDWLATAARMAQRSHPFQKATHHRSLLCRRAITVRPITAHFDGYVEQMMRVSSTLPGQQWIVIAIAFQQALLVGWCSVSPHGRQVRVVAAW